MGCGVDADFKSRLQAVTVSESFSSSSQLNIQANNVVTILYIKLISCSFCLLFVLYFIKSTCKSQTKNINPKKLYIFHDFAVLHVDNAVGNGSEVMVVSHNHQRLSKLVTQIKEQTVQFLLVGRVQAALKARRPKLHPGDLSVHGLPQLFAVRRPTAHWVCGWHGRLFSENPAIFHLLFSFLLAFMCDESRYDNVFHGSEFG